MRDNRIVAFLAAAFVAVALPLSAQVIITPNPTGGSGTVTGGSCTNQAATAVSSGGVPTCTTITSSFVDTTIAKTGTDINTSNQVTATHLSAALPVAQGGTGATSGTVAFIGSNQTFSGNNTHSGTNTMSGTFTFSNILDASAATRTAPIQVQASAPGTCTTKDLYVDSTSNVLSRCSATNTWTQITGAGAATTLNNLGTTSLNASLLFQTTLNVGSAAAPPKNIFFYGGGTFGSHSIKLDATPTGNRTLTIPDATDTVAVLAATQSLTNKTLDATNTVSLSTLGTTTANYVLAGPDASNGVPVKRQLVPGDLPQTVTEGSITTTVTISTYNGTYVVNCASACTINLPTVTGHTGSTLEFRMAAASKPATLDGNSTETVWGSLTRVLVANEAATIVAESGNWGKLIYSAVPAQCWMSLAGAQSVTSAGQKVLLDTTIYDNVGMADTTNHRCNIIRPGNYEASFSIGLTAPSGTQGEFAFISNNGGTAYRGQTQIQTSTFAAMSGAGGAVNLTTSDSFALWAGADNSTALLNGTWGTGSGVPFLKVVEIPQ